jgi:hypothetical protein
MRRIPKQVSQSASRIRRRARTKRQAYADLRYLISLESLAKKIKLPFIQRAGADLVGHNSSALDPTPTPSEAGLSSMGRSEGIATAAESRLESRNMLLVVDQRLSMYYGSKQKMKSVVAAEAAALFAWHAFTQKDRVGAVVFNDREVVVLAPHCSRVQVMLIFHDLLNQNHRLSGNPERKSNPGMLNQALRRVAEIAQRNSYIVLVTDGSGQDQVTGSILQNVSAHNDLAVILVYDPRQLECSEDRTSSANRLSFRPNLSHSCFFTDGTLTIPLNNQVDAVDQFRRGFRKLLRLRRYQSKQLDQVSRRDGNNANQTEAILQGVNDGNETTVSRVPSPPPPTQSLCAQLNSR